MIEVKHLHLAFVGSAIACIASAANVTPPFARAANYGIEPAAEKDAIPVQPVDPPSRPPISRERSPVLDQALSANSNAALIMFLLEHPGDPFADQARTYLDARRTPDSAAALEAAAGSQAEVVGAFDAARLSGRDDAWDAFLARYGDHPLAAEVPRFR